MKNNSLVTVIMPAYNHEKYIKEAIESIINQDYKNIELIITNDGSSDTTNDVILSLANRCEERFINFKYISRANKGLINTLKEMEQFIDGKYFTIF